VGVYPSGQRLRELLDRLGHSDSPTAPAAAFRSAGALAAYVSAVPGLRSLANVRARAPASTHSATAARGAQLWTPALSAVRFKPPGCVPTTSGCSPRGKLRKLAVVAAMCKSLLAVYSVAKNSRPFVSHLSP
jgi:transposase